MDLVGLAVADAAGLPVVGALLDTTWALWLGDTDAGAAVGVGSGAAVGDEHPATATNRHDSTTQHTDA